MKEIKDNLELYIITGDKVWIIIKFTQSNLEM